MPSSKSLLDLSTLRCVARGSRCAVYCAQDRNGRSPASDYLDDLSKEDHAKFERSFEKHAKGIFISDDRRKKLEGKIWEFKIHGKRILFFENEHGCFLTHGFSKKSNRQVPRRQIKKAERILEELEDLLGLKRR